MILNHKKKTTLFLQTLFQSLPYCWNSTENTSLINSHPDKSLLHFYNNVVHDKTTPSPRFRQGATINRYASRSSFDRRDGHYINPWPGKRLHEEKVSPRRSTIDLRPQLRARSNLPNRYNYFLAIAFERGLFSVVVLNCLYIVVRRNILLYDNNFN